MIRWALLVLGAVGLLGACAGARGSATGEPTAAATTELTIFAAASLTGVLDRVAAAYEDAHPDTTLTISTDSSAALATQIEQGAPADVFLSADTTNARRLADGGFAAGDPVVFAANALAVVVPADNPAGIRSPADLARPGVRIIAAGDEVPITRYASELVANLAQQPGYPADFEAAYRANVVSKEDNVRAVTAKIELGEGDAGIVYLTDARGATDLATIDVPAAANVPASYAGVVVDLSSHQAAARGFLDWLTAPDGQAILSEFGFLPPPAS